MQIGSYKFDRMEFAGSLGDLGTLIPFSVALMLLTGLSVTTVLLMVGLFYIISGFYYKLPIPVQPLKVVSAIAIAHPEMITIPVMASAGIIFGITLLCLSFTGLIDWLAKLFTKPVIRGIQLGLGFILMNKGIQFIMRHELFINRPLEPYLFDSLPVNIILGIICGLIALLLITNKRFPSTLIIISLGIIIGTLYGAFKGVELSFGPTIVKIYSPTIDDFLNAFILLVLPQIPLTLSNAVIGTADSCYTLFGKGDLTKRATYRGFASTMGFMNIFTGLFAGMPMCHGVGGLAAHYRFGARTGGSNIMIGIIFLIIAVGFGKIGIAILSSIPYAILGILLLFAGLELALLIRDVTEKRDLFIVFLIAGIGLATTNMGIAFLIGIIVINAMNWRRIEI